MPGVQWLRHFAPNTGDTGQGTTCHVMGPKKKKKVDGEGGGRGLLAMPRARWDFRPRPHYRESTPNPSIGMVES